MEESLERAVKSAAEGASPYLKNDKGETLRQKDRGESDPINLSSILFVDLLTLVHHSLFSFLYVLLRGNHEHFSQHACYYR